jgi:WD40 repeat protein
LWDPWSGRELLRTASRAQIEFSRDGRWLGIGWMGDCRYQLLEVVASVEYRSLSTGLGLGEIGLYEGDISPDGRWLALGTKDGVHVWHLSSGRLVARLPAGPSYSALFQPDASALITCGDSEVQRWPIDGTSRDELRFGAPEAVPLPFAEPTRISLTPDGRTLAAVSESAGKACVLPLPPGGQPQSPVSHDLAGFVALSRDARWLATGGWHSSKIRLWEARTGKALHEWDLTRECRVFFTPDDRELVVARPEGFDFWNLETLEQSRSLPREGSLFGDYVAFSPDGNLMALSTAPGIVEVKEVTTARTVVRLEDPFGDRSSWMAFTPDNRQLVVAAGWVPAIHVWDLAAIRERLEVMGLPADLPGSDRVAPTRSGPGR